MATPAQTAHLTFVIYWITMHSENQRGETVQITVRMPDVYRNRLDHVSKRLGIRRSDVIRLAMKQFLEGIDERPLQSPYARARHLLGIVESDVKDLGQSHRRYLIERVRKDSKRDTPLSWIQVPGSQEGP